MLFGIRDATEEKVGQLTIHIFFTWLWLTDWFINMILRRMCNVSSYLTSIVCNLYDGTNWIKYWITDMAKRVGEDHFAVFAWVMMGSQHWIYQCKVIKYNNNINKTNEKIVLIFLKIKPQRVFSIILYYSAATVTLL